jgi:glycosyltransferase involved in cell wall biosynthesis
VSERRVTAIYGGANDMFVPPSADGTKRHDLLRTLPPALHGRYLLVPSGIEWRKNLTRLFAAYSALDSSIRSAFPLVVQCHVSDAQRDDITGELTSLGIADDVTFTGFVPDDVLVALYQSAHLVIFPSLYEGLGLPVLEARHCGAPVICGDNSSLRELIPCAEARFDAESVPAIADRLHEALTDDALRTRLLECRPPDAFSWDAAAERFAEVLVEERDTHRRGRRPRARVAIVSPVPPEQCGPSMYINEMLPSMAEACDLTVFTAADITRVSLDVDVRVERLSMLEQIERLGVPFDDVVYFMGNSEYHLFYPEFLRRRPGAVVLHDARFHGLYREMARLRPDLLPEGFHGALHRMYPGRYPAGLGTGGDIHPQDVQRFGITMIADIARLATSIHCHSEHAADLVEYDCGRRPDVLFPLPVPPRRVTGESDPALVGSFGIVAPTKAPDLLIEAIAGEPDLRLVFVGPVGAHEQAGLAELADSFGCADRVTFTNEVSDDEYRVWLGRVGVMAQLRRTSNGESSGAVSDAISSGTPLVLSDMGSFSELPDDIAAKHGPTSPAAELGATLRRLALDPAARSEMIEAQARYRDAHSYAAAGRTLIESIVARAGAR